MYCKREFGLDVEKYKSLQTDKVKIQKEKRVMFTVSYEALLTITQSCLSPLLMQLR